MSDIVIRAEGLGKQYIIGHQATPRAVSLVYVHRIEKP